MTLKQAKAIVKAIGFTLTKRDNEYRLNLIGGKEATAYYTDDLGDALGTARAWHAKDLAKLEWQVWLDFADGRLPTMH